MSAHLIIAPANAGKTEYGLQQLQSAVAAAPLAEAWAILPNRTQAAAFQRRLGSSVGPGLHVNTYVEFYRALLIQARLSTEYATAAIIQRLLRVSVDAVAARGGLQHYAAIQHRPGFTLALADLVSELKRFRVEPLAFVEAVASFGPRLTELAALYAEYQRSLTSIGWADAEGLGWLALQALAADETLAAGWPLVVVDGFDYFNPTQLEMLHVLSGRVENLVVTLTGEAGRPRVAHRRFERTRATLEAALQPQVLFLPAWPMPVPALAHLEAGLFEPSVNRQPAGAQVTFLAAQTQALEAREALRWLKTRLVRDGIAPGACAVIALELGPYQPFLQQAAREFGLPIYFAEGEPLERNPAVAAFLNLLGLALHGWPHRALVDALRSPYFDRTPFGAILADSAADELNQAAYFAQVLAGLDQWEDALLRLGRAETVESTVALMPDDGPRPPRLPTGQRAADLWRGLTAFAARVTPPSSARPSDFVVWIEHLLGPDGLAVHDCAAAHAGTAARDTAALTVFVELLRELAAGAQVVDGLKTQNFAQFYGELHGAVRGAHYQPVENARLGAIYAGNLAGARGVSYRAVALLGLSEGILPRPLTEDPFLSDTERAGLWSRGLALDLLLRSDQQTLFYEAATRASDYLLFTRPYLADDGERWEPSPYWTAALSLFDTQPLTVRVEASLSEPEAASPLELLTVAARAGALPSIGLAFEPAWQQVQRGAQVMRARQARRAAGPFEGQTPLLASRLRERYGSNHVWSASRLEVYGECRFRYFVDRALGLELREAPAAGFDLAQLGGMLHTILETVYQQAADPADVAALAASLPAVAEAAFADAPRRHGFRPSALWDAQQAEWRELLAETLIALGEAGEGFRPAHFEVKFGFGDEPPLVIDTAAGPIRFHGVIDRVDVDAEGGLRLIDYKTGASAMNARDVGEGRRLQLPLYALAAEQVLGAPAVDGYYWGIRQGKASPLRLSKFAYPKDAPTHLGVRGAMDAASGHAAAFVQGIQSGEFTPEPPAAGCPYYCSARLFCWRYQPRAAR